MGGAPSQVLPVAVGPSIGPQQHAFPSTDRLYAVLGRGYSYNVRKDANAPHLFLNLRIQKHNPILLGQLLASCHRAGSQLRSQPNLQQTNLGARPDVFYIPIMMPSVKAGSKDILDTS
jgi:hypothetical protein